MAMVGRGRRRQASHRRHRRPPQASNVRPAPSQPRTAALFQPQAAAAQAAPTPRPFQPQADSADAPATGAGAAAAQPTHRRAGRRLTMTITRQTHGGGGDAGVNILRESCTPKKHYVHARIYVYVRVYLCVCMYLGVNAMNGSPIEAMD